VRLLVEPAHRRNRATPTTAVKAVDIKYTNVADNEGKVFFIKFSLWFFRIGEI
jgi:hypothetical protein